ncbi:MAG: hypothetical protein WCO45_16910 [Pseudanabaena sp. ELA607]|jgi:hypothetical protein
MTQIFLRFGITSILLLTLPTATDELIKYWQFPHIFSSIAGIASCIGACVPVLTMFRNSET